MTQDSLILCFLAEGGSIRITRKVKGEEERYLVHTNESYLEDEFYHSEKSFATFQEAMKSIYLQYPILSLHLETVDPDYILTAAEVIRENEKLKHPAREVGSMSITDREHLEALKKNTAEQWQALDELLEMIKGIGKITFVNEFQAGPAEADILISRIYHLLYDLKIVYPFDWSHWDEGSWLHKAPGLDYNRLDLLTLSKLITAIVRSDRFNGGNWISHFEDGTMQKMLEALLKTV
jgi:hypothetical protein